MEKLRQGLRLLTELSQATSTPYAQMLLYVSLTVVTVSTRQSDTHGTLFEILTMRRL